jgi:hypothetical protein
MSSRKSVAGQPVASPDATPMHHGLAPVEAISSVSDMRSSKVSGTS